MTRPVAADILPPMHRLAPLLLLTVVAGCPTAEPDLNAHSATLHYASTTADAPTEGGADASIDVATEVVAGPDARNPTDTLEDGAGEDAQVDTPLVADVPDAPDQGPAEDTGTPDAVADSVQTPDGVGPPDAVEDAVAPLEGTWTNPIAVDSFPFAFWGDTTTAPANVADAYSPCAPSTNESGGEYVFALTLPDILEPGTLLQVSVDDVSGDSVDIDVHVLDALSEDSCIARNNVTVSIPVAAGAVLYVTADTWVNSSGDVLAGPFTISMDLVEPPPAGTGDCLTNPIPQCTSNTTPTPSSFPAEPPGVGNCPPGSVLVDTFCVDRWEGAIAIVNADQSLTPWTPYAKPPSGATLRAVSAPGVVPQGHISQIQATAACAEAGKRLCTNSEWLRACQGPTGTTYPYGATKQPGVCNDDRECHPVVQYFESGASWVWSELNHPCINQMPDSVYTTGSLSSCITAEGAFDMMGNLHEWTSDPNGTFRGGFYKDTVINGPGCLYATTAHSVGHWDYSTGFRCCADPL